MNTACRLCAKEITWKSSSTSTEIIYFKSGYHGVPPSVRVHNVIEQYGLLLNPIQIWLNTRYSIKIVSYVTIFVICDRAQNIRTRYNLNNRTANDILIIPVRKCWARSRIWYSNNAYNNIIRMTGVQRQGRAGGMVTGIQVSTRMPTYRCINGDDAVEFIASTVWIIN